MFCVEILALCGITQMMMTSYLFKPLRTNMPTKWWKHTVSSPLCMGFWVGFIVYGVVALCQLDIEHSFPLAAAVATNTHVYVQWTLAFLLGGLVDLCVVLFNRIIELLYHASVLLAVEVSIRHERRILARKGFEEPEILDEVPEEAEE